MSHSGSSPEQRGTWEAAAPGWAKWEKQFSAGLVDATDALLDMAGIKPGMRVLDLACGAGSQTLRAASRVGSTGSVVATDISANMLEYVREHATFAIEIFLGANAVTAEKAGGTLRLYNSSNPPSASIHLSQLHRPMLASLCERPRAA
jgi:SAM-dependent methyltransferase